MPRKKTKKYTDMKKLSLMIALIFFIQTEVSSQSCLPEGIIFTTQVEIDNFQINYPSCTEIDGDVWIEEAYPYPEFNITNLNGLNVLTSIGGNLSVFRADSLVNFSGLENLYSIGGDIIIEENYALTSLTGLDNVTSIGGMVSIKYNDALISLTGLDNVDATTINDLTISSNSSLVTCEVESICSYLADPNGKVIIRYNGVGCNNPPEIAINCGISLPCLPYGNYYFLTQTEIDNFQTNYPGCTNLAGFIQILGDDITNVDGLILTTTISGTLRINVNENLTNLSGLLNLNSIEGSLIFETNDKLINFEGLNNLTSIGGSFLIHVNSSLTSCLGLDSLTSIGGSLSINGNDSLLSLTGFENLVSVGYHLYIAYNESLLSISSLENLIFIEGHLTVSNNNNLSSLIGLENIDAESIVDLSLHNNPSLSYCEVQSVCDYLASPNGIIRIYSNTQNCNTKEEVEEACLVWYPDQNIKSEIEIYPNPAKIELAISNKNRLRISDITIYNQLGQKVLYQAYTTNNIDISKLGQGIYIIELASNELKIRKKLIIEK